MLSSCTCLMMEQELKDFLVKEGIRSATLQCLIAEDIYSKDHFHSLLPKHFDHLLENKKISVGQHMLLT